MSTENQRPLIEPEAGEHRVKCVEVVTGLETVAGLIEGATETQQVRNDQGRRVGERIEPGSEDIAGGHQAMQQHDHRARLAAVSDV